MAPAARPENIVQGENYRITVLTPWLLRLEYESSGHFEDRATQVVLNRDFPAVQYRKKETAEELVIVTEGLRLTYNKKPFAANGLTIQMTGNVSNYRSQWYYGDTGRNLYGTARTLDETDGECALNDGLMSRYGYAVLEDGKSLVLTEDGWVAPREGSSVDLYFFGYGHDYRRCLRDFCHLAGRTPMLPRYALGNWWSRYYAYSEESYKALVRRFQKENVPFSVAVIDMDWHITDIDKKYGSGWTGFTWNRELFPDPAEFMSWLHQQGMKVTLNVHPADGIRAYEDAYPEMAAAMHTDTANEDPVEMDVSSRDFMEAYFRYVNHPHEKAGVDFWWIDWQQGTTTKVPGLDPLWMLNHFYFLDSGRDGKRPMTFSRYAGPGSHRYPIGFSGDTIVSWASLRFQPYFTSTASNIGYGWWSHDIGGHMHGIKDDEMAARWLQFGVFSPIMRLHSTNNEFNGKEPWRYSMEIAEVMKDFLRLRHRMIPYLYTMNYRAWAESMPLIQPMYYAYPEEDAAYSVKNQYLFGSECIAAPITEKRTEDTGYADVKVFLPEGEFIDFFTGRRYRGGRYISCCRDIRSIPVFIKAGGILPLMDTDEQAEQNPAHLHVCVFPGKNSSFSLYEDDSTSNAYLEGEHVFTKLEIRSGSGDATDSAADADGRTAADSAEKQSFPEGAAFVISAAEGDRSLIPAHRTWTVEFLGTEMQTPFIVTDGQIAEGMPVRTEKGFSVEVSADTDKEISIRFRQPLQYRKEDKAAAVFDFLNQAEIPFDLKTEIYDVVKNAGSEAEALAVLVSMGTGPAVMKAVAEILTAEL